VPAGEPRAEHDERRRQQAGSSDQCQLSSDEWRAAASPARTRTTVASSSGVRTSSRSAGRLEVLLVGAFALRTGTLSPPPTGTPSTAGARHQGARVWIGVAGAGGLLLLAWAAAPLALQHLVAGDVLRARWSARLRTTGPVALWLCVADRLAIDDGTWTISPASSTGVSVLGLPVEEALFFALTCLLVTDGLLLAADPAVRRRVTRRRSPHGRTGRSSRAPRSPSTSTSSGSSTRANRASVKAGTSNGGTIRPTSSVTSSVRTGFALGVVHLLRGRVTRQMLNGNKATSATGTIHQTPG